MIRRDEIVHALVSATLLGAFSALADWVWSRFIPDGAVLPGVAHGVVIFLLLAAVLSWCAGTRRAWRRLTLSLPGVGLLIAAAFYPIALVVGYLPALLVTWIAMWLCLALLQRWARDSDEGFRRAIVRAGLAAIGSGLAFWMISGIWTDPARADTGLLVRFFLWSFAFLPGFSALLWAHPRTALGSATEDHRRQSTPTD